MGYLAFQDIGGGTAARHGQRQAVGPVAEPEVETRLGALEWSVVALARRDRPSSLARPGRIATAVRTLFGRPNPMLADERLEALRRIAVLTWHHGYAVPSHEVRAFLAAGFSARQYEAVANSIGVARQRPPSTVIA